MKILIDDYKVLLPNGERPDIIVKSYAAGLELIHALGQVNRFLSWPQHDLFMDHDLGSRWQGDREAELQSERDGTTGYDLMCVIEQAVLGEDLQSYKPRSITCVSMNAAGRQRIQQVIDKIYGG